MTQIPSLLLFRVPFPVLLPFYPGTVGDSPRSSPYGTFRQEDGLRDPSECTRKKIPQENFSPGSDRDSHGDPPSSRPNPPVTETRVVPELPVSVVRRILYRTSTVVTGRSSASPSVRHRTCSLRCREPSPRSPPLPGSQTSRSTSHPSSGSS